MRESPIQAKLDIHPDVCESEISKYKEDYNGYLESSLLRMEIENPNLYCLQMNARTYSFDPGSIYYSHTFFESMLNATYKKLPKVKQSTQTEVLMEFLMNPVDYIFSSLEKMAEENLNTRYVLYGFTNNNVSRDTLSSNILTYSMLERQFLKDLGEIKEQNTKLHYPGEEFIRDIKEEKVLDLIYGISEKSNFPEEIFKFSNELLSISNLNQKEIKDYKIRDAKKSFMKDRSSYVFNGLKKLSKQNKDVFELICKYALKDTEDREELIHNYFTDIDLYYNKRKTLESKKNTLIKIADDYYILFKDIMNPLHTSESKEEEKAELADIFLKNPGLFYEDPKVLANKNFYNSNPDVKRAIQLASKYPDYFPGSLSFFHKLGKVSKIIDLDKLFEKETSFYPKIIENLDPIHEILIAGTIMSECYGLIN